MGSTNLKILDCLQQDATLSVSEIAKRFGLFARDLNKV